MKKRSFNVASMAMAIAMCVAATGCGNDEGQNVASMPQVKSEAAVLKDSLLALNTTYLTKIPTMDRVTRVPKWLRWLLVGAADVGGFLLSGDVGASASISTVVWTVTGDKLVASGGGSVGANFGNIDPNKGDIGGLKLPGDLVIDNFVIPDSAFKRVLVGGASRNLTSDGVTHNTIILEASEDDEYLLAKSPEEIVDEILDEATEQTGVVYSDEARAKVTDLTAKMVGYYDTDMSITEYMNSLKLLTISQDKKDALDACAVVLEGMQYVDDEDTEYLDNVVRIVNNSQLKPELKKVVLNGVSIADGSAKLWITDVLF